LVVKETVSNARVMWTTERTVVLVEDAVDDWVTAAGQEDQDLRHRVAVNEDTSNVLWRLDTRLIHLAINGSINQSINTTGCSDVTV